MGIIEISDFPEFGVVSHQYFLQDEKDILSIEWFKYFLSNKEI